MFHPALWKLIRLQWRGGWRQFGRSLRTFRGLFHLGFVIAMLLYGGASLVFAGMAGAQSPQFAGLFDKLQSDFLSLGLFTFTCYTILFSTGESTIYFTASEVAFLFPAPILRQQLVAYKLLKSLLGIFGLSLLFTFLSGTSIAMALPRMLSLMLTISFLQLLTMNVAFVRQLLRASVHKWIRVGTGALVGVMLLLAVNHALQSVPINDFGAFVKAFQESTTGSWILSPFQVFVWALRAKDWSSFLPAALRLLAVDGSLLILVFWLDALSLESALATSEKMTARIKLMQTKGVWHVMGAANSTVAKRQITQLPFWGGIGPIVWQRMTTTFRSSDKLVWLLGTAVTFIAVLVYMVGRSATDVRIPAIVGMAALSYLSFLICLTLQNDIERIGYLKSLPIRSISVVVGELIGFPVILSIIQSLLIFVEACFVPSFAPWLVCGAALTLPLNLVLFGVDKLVFYVYPTRMAKGAPGDFQSAGKQMIFMAMKMLMLAAAGLIVFIAMVPGIFILQSPLVAVASAGFVLAMECVALLPLLILAYDRFDASVATAG